MYRSMSRGFAIAAVAVAMSLGATSAAGAQTAVEADLRSRIDQQPGAVGPYLELAKVYADQQRYVEAMRHLQAAMALLQREQANALSSIQPRTEAFGAMDLPPGTVRVGGGILEPKKLRHVPPVYPAVAQSAFVQGVVILEVLIDTFGNVADTRVLRSVALLDQAATDAVQQWQFTPTLLNGVPVPVLMTVTVNFSLK
jgi:protein TonB